MQRAFAARIRNPTGLPATDVPADRMGIYQQLFYNNVERFLAGIFRPVKRLLGDARWGDLVRDFYGRHPSQSPYFRQLGRGFLAYLDSRLPGDGQGQGSNHEWSGGRQLADDLADVGLPPRLLVELCHFRWAKFSLRLAEDAEAPQNLNPHGDLLLQRAVVSPLACPLAYRYPVHEIETGAPAPAEQPTFLIVRRCADGRVRALVSNALTNRLLELLAEHPSGCAALAALAAELPDVDGQRLKTEGATMLNRLRRAEVLLGAQACPNRGANEAHAET